jgi:hypothetical protein
MRFFPLFCTVAFDKYDLWKQFFVRLASYVSPTREIAHPLKIVKVQCIIQKAGW